MVVWVEKNEFLNLRQSKVMDLLPPEIVREICKNMKDEDLAKFIQTSKYNKQVCLDVYEKRKKRYEEVQKYSEMEFDDIIDDLTKAERNRDVNKLKIIYEGLSLNPNYEDDFWEETLSNAFDWLVEILIDIIPVSIIDLALIKSDVLFEKILASERKIDMFEFEEAIAKIEDVLEPKSIELRVRLINERIDRGGDSEEESEEDL